MITATQVGREFRAEGRRLRYAPFGDFDWIDLPGEGGDIYRLLPDRDDLLIETTRHRYRLRNLQGSPDLDWAVHLEAVLVEWGE